ncbi:MAG TPA: YCF48-related protein [Rugosibacter sp.]
MKIKTSTIGLACAVLLAGLSGCSSEADLAAAQAERAKPIQRSDTMQAIATHGTHVAVGTQSGAVITSVDSGKTWTRHELVKPFLASIIDMAACPDGSFLGLDFYGKVWSSDVNGQKWVAHKLEAPQTGLTISCDKSGAWWVAGTYATIAKSSDQGKTWRVIDNHQDAQITTLRWANEKRALAMGEFGLVLRTDDGGETWQKLTPVSEDFYAYDVLFTDENTAWVSGVAGQMRLTKDGGKTWESKENKTGSPLYRLFLHKGTPYGVGARGTIARLEGETWEPVTYPDAIPVFLGGGADLEGSDYLLIGGPAGLLRSVLAK